MIGNIVAFIGLTFIGIFFGFLFTVNLYGWQRLIISFIIAVGVCGSLYGLMKTHAAMEKANYNKGYCMVCDGKLKFVNAIKPGKNQPMIYIYQCEKCGHIIESAYHE